MTKSKSTVSEIPKNEVLEQFSSSYSECVNCEETECPLLNGIC